MRLPRTSPRGQRGFLRLLTRVDLAAPLGFQFIGQVLSPGAAFDPADLPCPAVLLEYAGRHRIANHRSRYAFDDFWIIWRFDFDLLEWIEVVRARGEQDTSWSHDLAYLAHRRLFPSGESPAAERALPLIDALETSIGLALEDASRDVRCCVVAALDQYLACEMVRITEDLSVFRTGTADHPHYPRVGAHQGADPAERRPRRGI